jgi:aldose 1-epimerase
MIKMNLKTILYIFATMLFVTSCSSGKKNDCNAKHKALFAKEVNGKQTSLHILENKSGMKVAITNYGGKIVNLWAPDRDGKLADVVLGYNTIDEVINGSNSFGAIVGRYANRIAKGQFELDGQVYNLPINNGENCLHSGPDGFYVKIFDAKELNTPEGPAVELSYLSPDGENGFPGNLNLIVTYTLTEENELKIDYKATTDKPTVLNVTNHAYFNLRGEGNGDILSHEVVINSDKVAEVTSSELLPTGKYTNILGTPMDFTEPRVIGKDIDADFDIMVYGKGYDHAWAVNGYEKGKLSFIASAYEPESGRFMEVFTEEPAVQLYTGNWLDGTEIGKSGKQYGKRTGFCLETQHFPDSPNNPEYPTTVLRPGETYTSTTVYKFSTK